MNIELAAELWEVVQTHLERGTRADAATDFVAILVDSGADMEEMRTEFQKQPALMQALRLYMDDAEVYVGTEEDYEDSYDEDPLYSYDPDSGEYQD